MKQAIEGIENHVVKKYKSNSGGDKRAVVALADTETGEVFKTSFIRQIEVDEEQSLNCIFLTLLHSLTYHKQLFGFLVTL